MTTLLTNSDTSEAAIFARLWEGTASLPLSVARYLVRIGFSDQDKARMHDLAVRNQQGRLTAAELEELDNFVKVGDLLAIVQSKARRALKKAAPSRNGHG